MASNLMELNLVHSDLGITIYFSENMTKRTSISYFATFTKITHKISTYTKISTY